MRIDTCVSHQKVLYRAKIIQAVKDDLCDFFEDGGLLCENGVITGFGKFELLESEADEIHEFRDSDGLQTMLPPFSDIHFHWVQDRVSAMDKDALLRWLENFVFPEEANFADESFCLDRAKHFASKLFRCGTLSGAIYSSIHPSSFSIIQEALIGHFLVGNVVMTHNSPDYLTQSKGDLFQHVAQLVKNPKYAVTPRFALSCDAETLLRLGELVTADNFVQTHLSETLLEVKETLGLYGQWSEFADIKTYLEIYQRAGLIQKRCILGHCIHLEDSEWKVLAETQAAIAHCPTSNAPQSQRGLGSGLFDLERARREGVRWALASDIGAGPYLSMLDVMQSFLQQHSDQGCSVTATEALYRATLAGAHILEIYELTGFKPGNWASFVVLPSCSASDAEHSLRQILDSPRERFNELSRAVCHRGDLRTYQ